MRWNSHEESVDGNGKGFDVEYSETYLIWTHDKRRYSNDDQCQNCRFDLANFVSEGGKEIRTHEVTDWIRDENCSHLPFLEIWIESLNRHVVDLIQVFYSFTSGFKLAINQMGKQGSSMAIAIVDTKMAPEILIMTTSDSSDE